MNEVEKVAGGRVEGELKAVESLVFELSQEFFFDAAHRLVREVQAESSARIHGHTYCARVVVKGEVGATTGMVMDVQVLKGAIEEVRGRLDHRLLDDVEGLGQATIENLCRYLFVEMRAMVPGVCAVEVWREKSGDRCCLRVA